MSAVVPLQTEVVGAMPVIQDYLDKLDFAATINRLVPWQGEVPLGTLAEVLVINRLVAPKPLYRLGEWAEHTGLAAFYQLSPGQLNDDRLGRALERLAEHAHDIEAALTLRAVKVFDLDLARVHYDLTSLEFFGAYHDHAQTTTAEAPTAEAPPAEATAGNYQPPKPTYGRSKSGRKDLKQVVLGLDVLGDGAVPVGHAIHDGNTAEATTHLDNLKRLRAVLPTSKFLLITDSKGDTEENLLRVRYEGCEFLCTGAFTPALQQRYLRLKDKMHKINYYPNSQEKLPPDERDEYRAHEVEERLVGEVEGKTVRLRYRLIFVWSQARARQKAQTRERHLGKVRLELEKVERNLNKYKLKTRSAIVARLEKAKGRYDEGKLFTYEVTEEDGQFRLSWGLDEEKLAERKALEGVYVVKTNRGRSKHPVVEVLKTYKEQSSVERRISHLKGPLVVTPAFLENPQRIAGLVGVVVWALLVLALVERQVRKGLKGKPLRGLYPEGRACHSPSGPTLLGCFSNLCVVRFLDQPTPRRQLAQLTPLQLHLLDLLGILETDLHTYLRCASP